MLTASDRKKIEDTIGYYDTIGVIGRAKARKYLDGLSSEAKQKEILDLISRAEYPGYLWQGGWKLAARAWMLAKLMEGDRYLSYGNWDAPPAMVVDGWVKKLETTYEDQIKREITAIFAFAGDLSGLAALLNSPARNHWDVGAFTNPLHHRADRFRYIIYALTPSTGMPSVTAGSNPRSDYLKSKLEGYLDRVGMGWDFRCAQYYMENPTVLHAELLSCSLISNEFVKTYRNSPFGFVLNVPKQCLCYAESKDMALSNADSRSDALAPLSPIERIATVSRAIEPLLGMYAYPLRTPDEIIEASKGGGHNELAVVGSISGLQVKPSAIFVKVASNGMLWQSLADLEASHNILRLIDDCSKRFRIPVVAIPDDSEIGSGLELGDWFPDGKF